MTTGSAAIEPKPLIEHAFCQIALPVYWSKDDTPETIKQVKAHNAVYKELCIK